MNLTRLREQLASLLGCPPREVDDALRDEQHARRILGRRGFLAAATALAAAPVAPVLYSVPSLGDEIIGNSDSVITIGGITYRWRERAEVTTETITTVQVFDLHVMAPKDLMSSWRVVT